MKLREGANLGGGAIADSGAQVASLTAPHQAYVAGPVRRRLRHKMAVGRTACLGRDRLVHRRPGFTTSTLRTEALGRNRSYF